MIGTGRGCRCCCGCGDDRNISDINEGSEQRRVFDSGGAVVTMDFGRLYIELCDDTMVVDLPLVVAPPPPLVSPE